MSSVTTTTVTPAVLVTANRAVAYGTVARWLLHELRSPAQALSLIAELMEPDGAVDDELQRTLCDSARQLARCVEMLDRTLRPVTGVTEMAPVVLAEIFRFLNELYSTRRSSVELDLSQLVAQRLPAVSGAENALEHALLNLLMNAVEAVGDREGGRVAITASATPGQVEVVVDDNGPGVAPEIRDRLFQPYVTTKPNADRAVGLGLTVARHLVQLSGGTVAYTPKEGPGARFVVRLLPWSVAPR
jgi:signal transduction histidine kinase